MGMPLQEPINIRQIKTRTCANCHYLTHEKEMGSMHQIPYDWLGCGRAIDNELPCDPSDIERTVCDGFKWK